jgi:hypothetical protein
VVKTTLEGEVVYTIGQPPRPDLYDGRERKFIPTQVAAGPNGHIYIADGYGESYVHIYTTAGQYLDSFGGLGAAPGQLHEPHGISIDPHGGVPQVQVSNRANIRIDNFTLEGKFAGTVLGSGHVRYPCTTVHAHGEMVIPDLFCRISIFGKDNRLIAHLGDYLNEEANVRPDDLFSQPIRYPELKGYPNIPHGQRLEGKFSSPHDVHVDGQGNLYVAEWIEDGRLTKLTRV